MAFGFQVLLFVVLGCFSHGEVSEQFAKCRNFFYKGRPPAITGVDLEDICQFYKASYYFASSYSTQHRIPVFSAYHLRRSECEGKQPARLAKWMVEPQLSDQSKPPQMDKENESYKKEQAINDDYRNTDFDKGHLNPNAYHCDDGRVATFTLTNCVPQNPCFNQQIWKAAEKQSKIIMNLLCNYPCAERYFVTGAVPTKKKIPHEIHDKEASSGRAYERVGVPSQMWTAACCDTTACTDSETKKAGFSYGYIGNNTADPYLHVLNVHELEETLEKTYTRVYDVEFRGIFTDDKCNINEKNSKKARDMMKVPIAKKMINEVRTMSLSQVSSLPERKRELISEEERTYKSAKLSDAYEHLVLSNAQYGMKLSPDEYINTRNELRLEGLSLVKINHLSLSPTTPSHTELKRTVGQNSDNQDWSVYNVVRKQSKDLDIAYDGTFCRYGHRCGKYGTSYTWCYTDWGKSPSWQYCCQDDCDFRGEDYTYCKIGNKAGWGYCSQRSSLIPVNGVKRCLQDHPCGLYGEDYYWCYVDLKKNWEYCCQPWDPCRDRKDGSKKWCYSSRSKRGNWHYCT